MPPNILYACLVVFVLYILATWHTRTNEDYLYGFWVADGDAFCEESDIESMLVFIGEPTGWWKATRMCYIIIMDDLCNQGFTMKYRRGWAPTVGKYSISADVVFDDIPIWEDNVTFTHDIRDGTLTICSGDTIYAKLTKEHDTTNLARAVASVELVD